MVLPVPSYLFARCCEDTSHCTNVGEPDYSMQLLSDFLQMRNNLIKQLVGSGLKNFKALDACCVTTCTSTANTAARLSELKRFTAKVLCLSRLQEPSGPRCSNTEGTAVFPTKAVQVSESLLERLQESHQLCSNPDQPLRYCAAPKWNVSFNIRGLARGRPRGFGFHPYRRR